MDKAIALYRVSTYRQSIEGHSLEAQEERVRAALEVLKAEIIKEWRVDTSSKKGKNIGRKDLKEALRFCKQNKVKYFVIDEVDRFMRSIDEYYWYKLEFKKLGVKLVFASQPELGEESQYAKFQELKAIYDAESSNDERSRKTQDKMSTRYKQGYYLSHPHAGYKKSNVPGIHIKDEARFELLKKGSRLIIYEQYLPEQAVAWMNAEGYKTIGGKKLDLNHYVEFIVDRYYCGIIDIKGSGALSHIQDVTGLHEPMFSVPEHELLCKILRKRNPRVRLKHNPEYPLANLIRHYECKNNFKKCKFSGFAKDKGYRNGTKRPFAPMYRCRSCRKEISRLRLHESVSFYLSRINVLPDDATFKRALLKVWRNQIGTTVNKVIALEAMCEQIENEIRITAKNYAKETDAVIKNSMALLLKEQNNQLNETQGEIAFAKDTDLQSEGFIKFAFEFLLRLKEHWWDLSFEQRRGGEQVLFAGEFYIDSNANVHTPKLSSILRLASNKKELKKLNFNLLVELVGTAPTSD